MNKVAMYKEEIFKTANEKRNGYKKITGTAK